MRSVPLSLPPGGGVGETRAPPAVEPVGGTEPARSPDRRSSPQKSWHSLGHLLHPGRPATAAGLCYGPAHAVSGGRVAGCRIAGKLSGRLRGCMRAGRPRSRVAPPPITLAPLGDAYRLAGPQPGRCGRAVTLGGPSWITLFSLVSSEPFPEAIRCIDVSHSSKSGPGLRDARTPESANHPSGARPLNSPFPAMNSLRWGDRSSRCRRRRQRPGW